MSRFAKVTSTDAVERMATALDSFQERATAALDCLQQEVRRAFDWIQHDRKEFWDQEVRRGWDRVTEARNELERRRVYRRVGDHEPDCREEKLALEKAKRRLHAAEQKVELVRRWGHAVQHELIEYQGAANQLVTWLQGDHPRALADLKRMIAALDSYVALHVPAETSPGAPSVGSGGPPADSSQPDQQESVKEVSQESPSDPVEESDRGELEP